MRDEEFLEKLSALADKLETIAKKKYEFPIQKAFEQASIENDMIKLIKKWRKGKS